MLKNKFAIGVLVQWYEIDIVEEYINSLIDSVGYAADENNIIIDITLSLNTELEKPDAVSLFQIEQRMQSIIDQLKSVYTNVYYRIETRLYTIADYRREFNNTYCNKADVLIWGETDMLLPKQTFNILDELHEAVKKTNPKYVATFGICKMWDKSWEPLEHPKFTIRPFIENDYTNWWSLKYTMNKNEMDEINDTVENLDIHVTEDYKFNGCGLIISSEVIKSGVNIPQSVFFVTEDTAFMIMLKKILPGIPQYIIKNVLMVHNRNHPLKRTNVKNESGNTMNEKRRSNEWYKIAHKMSEINCYNIFNPNHKAYTWDDVFKQIT